MKVTHYASQFGVCVGILASIRCFAADVVPTYPTLTMHGETYENSCSPKSRKKLMENISKNVLHGSRSLQSTVELILCGDRNSRNRKRMIHLIDQVVVTSYEGTGEKEVTGELNKKIDVLKIIMAGGRAWEATLIFDETDVKLQYFSNEACVKSIKARYFKNSWLVHEIGEACD